MIRRFRIWWRWQYLAEAIFVIGSLAWLQGMCVGVMVPPNHPDRNLNGLLMIVGMVTCGIARLIVYRLNVRDDRTRKGREWRHRVAQERSGLR